LKSPGPAGESIGDQDDGDEELRSADDMEDDGDGEDNKLMESLGHLDDCTDVQEGCDEEGDIADDVEDNEDSDDTEEVEDPSLTNSGKQRQLEIHVGHPCCPSFVFSLPIPCFLFIFPFFSLS
jgi:hypothetical protein